MTPEENQTPYDKFLSQKLKEINDKADQETAKAVASSFIQQVREQQTIRFKAFCLSLRGLSPEERQDKIIKYITGQGPIGSTHEEIIQNQNRPDLNP